ncbi:MAG: S1 RNA-binding domain-containing protein, partial [Desulfovibrionaceae bacterium]
MEETQDLAQTPEMDVNFETALEDYLNPDFGELDEGTIVQGEVVKVEKDHVLVDVNFKSEGQVPAQEFTDSEGALSVSVGDKVDVFVVNKNESEGTITLSRDKAKRMRLFDRLEDVQERD